MGQNQSNSHLLIICDKVSTSIEGKYQNHLSQFATLFYVCCHAVMKNKLGLVFYMSALTQFLTFHAFVFDEVLVHLGWGVGIVPLV